KRVVPSSLRSTAEVTACRRCSVKPISLNLRRFKAQPARNRSSKSISKKFSCCRSPKERSTWTRRTISRGCNRRIIPTRPKYRLELGGCSACCNDGCVNITPTLAEEATATIGKNCGNFGNNRECDFFGGLAADVESRRSVQVSGPGFEIKRSIFAKPRQQLGVTLFWPQQSNISKLEWQKAIKREKIPTEIVIHH